MRAFRTAAACCSASVGRRHRRRPELARAEVDHRLDHVHRGRVGRRLGAARPCRRPCRPRGTGRGPCRGPSGRRPTRVDGHPRDGDRHVHHHPLVERRQELAPRGVIHWSAASPARMQASTRRLTSSRSFERGPERSTPTGERNQDARKTGTPSGCDSETKSHPRNQTMPTGRSSRYASTGR